MMDLFATVMNELSSTIEDKDGKYRKVFPEKGEHRYKDNRLGVDYDERIVVYAGTEEDLKFAKKVAGFYGCDYRIVQHERAPENGAYECKICVC